MSENKSQTQHITKLDFDISAIQPQLNKIKKMLEEASKSMANSNTMGKNMADQFDNATSKANKLKDVVKSVWTSNSKGQALFQNMEADKAKLESILATLGKVSQVVYKVNQEGMLKSANVSRMDETGKKIIENYQLQRKFLGELENGVKMYENSWVLAGKTISNNIRQQEQALLRQQKQQQAEADRYIRQINQMIEKRRDFNTLLNMQFRPNATIKNENNEILKQLQLLQDRIRVQKSVSATDKERLTQLQAQTRELQRQAAASKGLISGLNTRQMVTFLSQLTGFYGGVYALNRGLRELISTMNDVEFKVMEISRVAADANFDKLLFTDQLFDISTNYARNFDEASDAVLRFVQAGYDSGEATNLAAKSMLALNTAELDATQSTQSLIGIMKQWDLSADDYEGLIDRINKTADSFAITSQDLVDGLLKSSSVARLANIDFENTVGVLTAMKVTSGASGKEVGNAFKSILSYIQRPNSLKTFESMGIDVYKDEVTGELNDMMDILASMTDVWNKADEAGKSALTSQLQQVMPLTKELAILVDAEEDYENAMQATNDAAKANDQQTRDLATAAAGVYRKNYFTALMDNFSMVADVVANMNDVEGYSMQENSKYMDTLTARYNIFIATLERSAVAIGESGLMDLAKILLDIGTQIANLANAGNLTLPILVTTFTTLYSIFKKQSKLLPIITGNFKNVTAAIVGQTTVTGALRAGQEAYNATALKTIAVNGAMTMGITALIAVLVKAIGAAREESAFLNKAQNDYDQRMKSINEMAEAQKADMEVIRTYIGILEQSMDAEGRSNLTKEVAASYIKKINEALGENSVMYDENTGRIQMNTETLNGSIEALERQITAKLQQDELEERIRQKATLGMQMEQLRLEIAEQTAKVQQNYANSYATPSDLEERKLDNLIAQLSILEGKYQDVSESIGDYVDAANNFNTVSNEVVDNYQKEIEELDVLSQETNNAVNQLEVFVDMLEGARNGMAYSAEEITNLTNLYPELTDAVYMNTDGYHLEEDALVDLANTAAAEANARIKDESLKTDASARNTQARIENIKMEIRALQALMMALNVVYGVQSMTTGMNTKPQALSAGNAFGYMLSQQNKELDKYNANLSKAQSGLAATQDALNKVNALSTRGGIGGGGASGIKKGGGGGGGGSKGGGGGGGSGSSAKETPPWEIEIEEFEFLRSMGQKTTQEVVDFYRKITQIAELSAEDRRKYEKKLYDEIKNQIQESLNLQLEADKKRLESLKETASKAKDANSNFFSDLRTYRDNLYQQYEEEANKQIEAINSSKDAELKAIDEVQDARDKARQKEEYERNRQKILEDIATASVRSGQQYRRAEREGYERLEDLDRQWEETQRKWDIEEQKRQIEELKQAEIEAVNEMLAKNKAFVDEQVKNLLGTIAYIFDNAKKENGVYTEETIKQIASQLTTMSSLISGMTDVYSTAALDPINEMEDLLTEKLNNITDAQITNLETKISDVEAKFDETNMNMKAYSATYSDEIYNEYLNGFILPMSNGVYDGFTLANNYMLQDAVSYVEELNAIYSNIQMPNLTLEPNYVPSTLAINQETMNGLSRASNDGFSGANSTSNNNSRNNTNSLVVQGNLLNMDNKVSSGVDINSLAGKTMKVLNNLFNLKP